MKELSIEQRLVAKIKLLGGVALKGENVAGFPDRIVLIPGGHVYFVETKQPKGRMEPRQTEWMYDLLALGMQHRQIWNREDLRAFLEEVRNEKAADLYWGGGDEAT